MKIKSIHQIEITSNCNLRCKYCVHPKMKRAKVDMNIDVFTRALDWASKLNSKYGQKELNLAGIGESTMHPDFIEYVALARKYMGNDIDLILATNGVAVTEDMVKALIPYRPSVWVSLHRPEKAGPAIELFKKYDLIKGASADPSVASINWAGQVNWHLSAPEMTCQWMKESRVMITAEGQVTSCCLDGNYSGIIGHVNDNLFELETGPYELCNSCNQLMPEELKNVS